MNLLAQIKNPALPPAIGSGSIDDGALVVGKIIGASIGIFMIVSFFMAFSYLVLGGFSWITSGGDKNGLEAARNKITHAIVGLIIVAAAWSIMTLVGDFIGIDFPNVPLPTIQQ